MSKLDREIDAMQWKIEGKCVSCGSNEYKELHPNDTCNDCFIADNKWRDFLQVMEKHR